MTTEPKRGFAACSPERRREIASAGGKAAQASGRGHRFTSEEARAAGAKGGAVTAADREHMAAIGKIGGSTTAAKPGHMTEIARRGGEATRHARTEPEAS